MTTTVVSNPQAEAFRDEMARSDVRISRAAALAVLERVGDGGVAKDALLMVPRPLWLKKLVAK